MACRSTSSQATYPGGARKATYRDPDGNEISFGGAAAGRMGD